MRLLDIIRRGEERDDEIDIAPLIDIVFILLIFFMVSTTFVRSFEVDIDRPSAASAELADVRAIRVSLSRMGEVHVDGQAVQPWMVQGRVRDLVLQDPRRPVLVTADTRVETGRAVELVDECRLAGAKQVALDVHKEY